MKHLIQHLFVNVRLVKKMITVKERHVSMGMFVNHDFSMIYAIEKLSQVDLVQSVCPKLRFKNLRNQWKTGRKL